MKYVNPTNDLAFKKVLGSSENVHILSGFIKDFFGIEPKDLAIENPYSIKSYKELINNKEVYRLRQTISDIAATMQLADYRSELQLYKDKFYDERSLYYPLDKFVSRYRITPGEKTSGFARLRPMYALNILGYNHFTEDADALRIFKLYDPVRNKGAKKDLLHLGHFELLKPNVETANQRDWQNYFLQKPLSTSAPEYIQEALYIIDQSNMREEEVEMIAQLDYYQSIYDGQIEHATDVGIEIGREQGLAKGREELIRGMVRANVPIDYIVKASGYTAEEIEALR